MLSSRGIANLNLFGVLTLTPINGRGGNTMIVFVLPKWKLFPTLVLFVFLLFFILPAHADIKKIQKSTAFISFLQTDNGQEREISVGTGFMVHPWGVVLTNKHVIEGRKKLQVLLGARSGGGSIKVKKIFQSDDLDLAVLTLDIGRTDFPYLSINKYYVPEPNEEISTYGWPGNNTWTSLTGHIASRTAADWKMNADNSSGMSGGPVINKYEEVIGIATAEDADANTVVIIPIAFADEFIGKKLPMLWPPSRHAASGRGMPRKYALLIGLNTYQFDTSPNKKKLANLKYAESDVQTLKKVLSRLGYEVSQPLTGGYGTREAIIAKLNDFSGIIRGEDEFLLYFAGHGVRHSANGETYWLTYDTNIDRPDVKGIRLPHLLDYVKDINARKKIVILDHCYSGELGPREKSIVIAGTARGMEIYPGNFNKAAFVNRISNRGQMWPNTFVIAAARGNAYEIHRLADGTEVKSGLLTYVITEALTTKPDTREERRLTLKELSDHVMKNVKELSNGSQEAQIPPHNMDTDTVAFVLRNAEKQVKDYIKTLEKWTQKYDINSYLVIKITSALNDWRDAEKQGEQLPENRKRFVDALIDLFELKRSLPDEERASRLVSLAEKLSE